MPPPKRAGPISQTQSNRKRMTTQQSPENPEEASKAPQGDAHDGETPEGNAPEVGKRIGRNSLYMVVRTVAIMLVSLYTSRLTLNLLGETDYGIYSIVAGFVLIFSFINIAMERSITRFLMYERGRGSASSLGKMFNVAILAQIAIAGCVLVAGETIGLWYVNNYLNVPPDKLSATNWVYQFSLATLCFNIAKVPYNAMIITFERFSFYAIFSFVEVLLRLAAVMLLLLFSEHLLVIYAAQFFGVTVVVFFVYKLYCRHAAVFGDVCRFHRYWNRDKFLDMVKFCGWSTLGSASGLGAYQGAALILNYFFGVVVNAAFGLSTMVQQAGFNILSAFQTAYSPKLVALYAREELEHLREFIYRLGKYSFYISASLLVPLCLNMDIALHLWLGNDVPQYTAIFCILSLVCNGIDCIAAPGLVCNQATGRVRNFNIVWSILMLSNLPFDYIVLRATDWAPATLVVRAIINVVVYLFFIWMMRAQVGLRPLRYIASSLLKPLVIAAFPFAVAWVLRFYMGDTFLSAVVNSLVFWLVFAAFIFLFGLDKEERSKVTAKLSRFIPALHKS